MLNRFGIPAFALLHVAGVTVGCNIDERIVSVSSLQGELGGDAGAEELDERGPEGLEPSFTGDDGTSSATAASSGGGAGEVTDPITLSGNGGGTTGSGGAGSLPAGSGGTSAAMGGSGGTSAAMGGSQLEPAPPVDDPAPPSVVVGRAGAEFCTAEAYPSPLSGAPRVQQLFVLGETNRHIDGPVWVDGALYFSAVRAFQGTSRIDRFVPGGLLETSFLTGTDTNGLAVDTEGNLLAASHGPIGIYRFVLPLGPRSLVTPDTSFISPNDLVQRSDGNIYFTDLNRDNFNDPASLMRALRITPDGQVLQWDPNLFEANGITLSPDGNHLYVTTPTRFVRYPIAADGTPLTGVELSPNEALQSPEGMAMDCAGNVYTTETERRLVRIFDAFGNELGRFGGPQVFAGDLMNLAFGGPDRTTLFITTLAGNSSASLYAAELNVPGLPY